MRGWNQGNIKEVIVKGNNRNKFIRNKSVDVNSSINQSISLVM